MVYDFDKFKFSLFRCRQTVVWLVFWEASGLADFVLETVFMSYKNSWSATTIFHIWNLKGLITNEGLHMLIPWTLSISEEQKTPKRVEFYVRKPTVLTPRRQNSVKVDNGQRRVMAVKECGSARSQKPEIRLLRGKLHMSTESFSDKLDSVQTIPGTQNAPKSYKSQICTADELKLSIPNLVDQGHFETIVYCKCHKMSKVVIC